MAFTTLLAQIGPVFALVLLGVLLSRSERFGEQAAAVLNDVVYYLALPALIFHSVATSDLSAGVPTSALAVAVGLLVVAYLLGVGVALLGRVAGREANAVGLVAGWGNVGYMGIPLTTAVLGPASALAASLVSTLHTALAVSVFLVVATLVDHDRTDGHPTAGSLALTLARRVLGNPVVIAIVLGVLVAALRVPLPGPVSTTVGLVGDMAAPGGLLALGILLRAALPALRAGRTRVTTILGCTLVKLVAMPALAVGAVRLFAVPAPWAAVLVVMAALPDAATVFVLTAQYRTWYRESTAVVVLTTADSAVTLPVVLTLAL
ncbi:AEC family transporter [Actinomycetospora sp. TBRC 11914]|uniref:AEC family transporter n=1 Tax=Actinomycetospora sp. TBRC 11914 TaxID=2729387 RepID=UPI00145CC97F|nr:AEC family transporter [Actinomycetospora sp. TBRC 11914]NMO92112.1 AEC family transporter [Actinomycetospora sp. TBRC 11914]